MIKVALIIERANIELGGAERSILELTEALTELGVNVTLLAATGNSKADNIKVLCGNNKNGRTSLQQFGDAILEHLKTNSYDIIHSTLPFSFADIYQPRGGSYAEAIIRNAASYRSPLHSYFKLKTHFLNSRRTELFNAEKTICQMDDGPILAALSVYVKNQFIEHYGMNDQHIALIPNAVKLGGQIDDNSTEEIKTKLKKALNIESSDQAAVFLFAANNFRLKGLTTILKALQIAEKTDDNRKICVAVAGNDKKKAKFEATAQKLGVADRIVFLDSLKGISSAMAACDAAVLATYYDPCSRFILEGLAAAKPVITTKYNGAAEFFKNGVHGAIIDNPADEKALAEAMKKIGQKTNAQLATSAIIEDNLNDNVSIMRHGRQMLELYDKIIEGRQRK